MTSTSIPPEKLNGRDLGFLYWCQTWVSVVVTWAFFILRWKLIRLDLAQSNVMTLNQGGLDSQQFQDDVSALL